jgi:hypothetical protein
VAPDDATTKPGDATTKPGDATRRPPGATTLQVRRDDGAGQRDGDPTRREEPARRCHTRSRHRVCATFSLVVMTKPKPTTPTDDDDNHFDGLAAALGKPDPELLAALLDGTIEADLVAKGRDIASSRVLTDMRRVYTLAHTFWSGAPAETRDKLRGFSPELLAIAVDQALVLEGMAAEHEMTGQDHDAGRAKRDAALREAFSRALTLRDQAYEILRGVAGTGEVAQKELASALGTAEDAAALTRGLQKLVELGKRYLSQKKGPIAVRAKLLRLDDGYLDRLEAAADALAKAAKKAGARPAGQKVTQGALDRADGVNLLLLGLIIRAFENAHEEDPTIPRLVPIATRRLFSRSGKKKPAAKGEDKDGTPKDEDGTPEDG